MAHMHYKGTGKIHSFRGLLADGEERKIRIQGSVGAIAWRIRTLQGINETPGIGDVEYIIKVYRESQSSIDGVINFGDTDLIACYFQAIGEERRGPGPISIVDRVLFNRNIFVTAADVAGSANINYYIELEEVKVGKSGMAQLAVAAARRTKD